MKLVKMIIKDYRQFERVEVDLDNDVTLIAGANNSGKTSLITLVKNIMANGKDTYGEADIPAKNMKQWVDQVYPLFKEFFSNNGKLDCLEEQLINKILPQEEEKEKVEIKTTEVFLEIDYDPDNDDIRAFADYIMDLDDRMHSFFFVYRYEVNRLLFNANISRIFGKLQRRFQDLDGQNQASKERHLKEMLVRECVKAIQPRCYFSDRKYDYLCRIEDLNAFRNLFNFTYLKACRPLDDDDTDHDRTLSKQMVKVAELDGGWNQMVDELPDELLQPIQDHDVEKRVRDTSLQSLEETIEALKRTNGGNSGKLSLDMNITEESIGNLLRNITTATYEVDEYFLGEASQGLGYSNMIYMLLQLKEYEYSIDPYKVNIFFIEEPESHMHPQMQQVFIKYLMAYYQEKNLQGIITTHSDDMVRVAGLTHLRVIRRTDGRNSSIYNLAALLENLRGHGVSEDEELANFFDWFFEIGYSEIIFADKVIIYEGDTERLLIRKLLTLPKYEKLHQQYIAYIQAGGAYAYKYRKLLNLLHLKTLIITDLDYTKDAKTKEEITQSGTTNATIKHFCCDNCQGNQTIGYLCNLKQEQKNIVDDGLTYLAYQTKEDNYARTLEEAMLSKLFGLSMSDKLKRSEWKNKKDEAKLDFAIPHNKNDEEDSMFYLRDIISATSNKKTDFMYSVILRNLFSEMEPTYISEGLRWLMA